MTQILPRRRPELTHSNPLNTRACPAEAAVILASVKPSTELAAPVIEEKGIATQPEASDQDKIIPSNGVGATTSAKSFR
jgi:hypothetical protein